MRQAGIADANPSHPSLLTLIETGAAECEFVAAAKDACDRGKGFAYAIAIVANERKRAAALSKQVLHGTLPVAETPYQRSMRERMQEVAPMFARKDPSANKPVQAVDFLEAIAAQQRLAQVQK